MNELIPIMIFSFVIFVMCIYAGIEEKKKDGNTSVGTIGFGCLNLLLCIASLIYYVLGES